MLQRFASSDRKDAPPPPSAPAPPPHQTYLQRYSTVFGKSIATVRHLLNRFQVRPLIAAPDCVSDAHVAVLTLVFVRQPWSSDHRFAIASWGVVGGVWWILAGTTAFLSLLIWAIPSDKFQVYVAAKVSEVGHM